MIKSISVLSPETHFKGILEVSGEFHLYGAFEGELKSTSEDSTIFLEKGSKFSGKIYGGTVHVLGHFDGELNAELTHILPSASVKGAVKSKRLDVSFGAQLEARIT